MLISITSLISLPQESLEVWEWYGKRTWEGGPTGGSLEKSLMICEVFFVSLVSGDEGDDSCHWGLPQTALAVVVGIH